MIEGRRLIIKTDHKPLIYAFNQRSDKATPRQLRHLSYIGQFTIQIIHISRKENVVADALSRLEPISLPIIVSTDDLATAQEKDKEFKQLLKTDTSSLQLKKLRLEDSNKTLYCDVSQDEVRPYVPKELRKRILQMVHDLSHSSIKSTRKTITKRFIWPTINKDVNDWVRTYMACQRNKIHKHTRLESDRIPMPDARFQHVHLDLIGPLPLANGYKFCFIP